MTSHKKVLRLTAFHALASCYPDLHRPMGPMDENEILMRASEELTRLRRERDRWLSEAAPAVVAIVEGTDAELGFTVCDSMVSAQEHSGPRTKLHVVPVESAKEGKSDGG